MAGFLESAKKFMGFLEEDESETPKSMDPNKQRTLTKRPLVNFSMTSPGKMNQGSEVRVIEPKNPDQSLDIANSLREGVPVIINLRFLEADESKRLFDFICGTTYAIDGHYRKLGDNILLFTPGHISIVEGDRVDRVTEMEQEQRYREVASR